jgi:hypothetical protein
VFGCLRSRCFKASIRLEAEATDDQDSECGLALCSNGVRYRVKSRVPVATISLLEVD